MAYFYKTIESPIGDLKLIATEKGLAAVLWDNNFSARLAGAELIEQGWNASLMQAQWQLEEFFAGTREVFTLPLDLGGFECRPNIVQSLLKMPCHGKRSYDQLADDLSRSPAMISLGGEHGGNPLRILASCFGVTRVLERHHHGAAQIMSSQFEASYQDLVAAI